MGDLFQLTVQRPLIRPNVVWVTGHCSLDDLGDSPLIMKRALGFEEEDTSPELPAQRNALLLRPLSGVPVTWGGLGSYPDFS
jgi:hypothetical protein